MASSQDLEDLAKAYLGKIKEAKDSLTHLESMFFEQLWPALQAQMSSSINLDREAQHLKQENDRLKAENRKVHGNNARLEASISKMASQNLIGSLGQSAPAREGEDDVEVDDDMSTPLRRTHFSGPIQETAQQNIENTGGVRGPSSPHDFTGPSNRGVKRKAATSGSDSLAYLKSMANTCLEMAKHNLEIQDRLCNIREHECQFDSGKQLLATAITRAANTTTEQMTRLTDILMEKLASSSQ